MDATGALGAGAAAVAAVASWASVLQSRQLIRDATSPELRAGIAYVEADDPAGGGTLTVEIHNGGQGTARDVAVVLACEGQRASSVVAMFVHPGEHHRIHTSIAASSAKAKADGVVIWRDASEYLHGWCFDGRVRRLGGRRATITLSHAWDRFYPSSPLDAMEQRSTYRSRPL